MSADHSLWITSSETACEKIGEAISFGCLAIAIIIRNELIGVENCVNQLKLFDLFFILVGLTLLFQWKKSGGGKWIDASFAIYEAKVTEFIIYYFHKQEKIKYL